MRYVKTIECVICGAQKEVRKNNSTKTCSNRCRYKLSSKTRKRGQYLKCVQCGKKHWRTPSEQRGRACKFCSLECYWKNRDRKVELTCPICKKKFITSRSVNKRTCSRVCSNKKRSLDQQGRKVTWGKKISKGKNKGLTKIHKLVRTSAKYKEWRTSVFKRDNYTCVKCGVEGGYVEADHIIPFSVIIRHEKVKTYDDYMKCNFLWDISNGQTLCRDCHKKTKTFCRKPNVKQYAELFKRVKEEYKPE